jgi:hypothetical protein
MMRPIKPLTIFSEYVSRIPASLRRGTDRASGGEAGARVESFQELLAEDSVPPEQGEAISVAWESLFARAMRAPFGVDDAHEALNDLGSPWRQPSQELLARLIDEASLQVRAFSNGQDHVASPEIQDEAVRAARQVQFSLAQLFASSEIPSIFSSR